jgi:hypothetical protein
MLTRAQSLALLLLLAAAVPITRAQELVVTVESSFFPLDTRLSIGSGPSPLVVAVESPAFTLDTRLVAGNDPSVFVTTATSPAFTLDTRLSIRADSSALVVTAESAAFTVDTRLAGSNPLVATLVVAAESGAFTLDTRLAERRGDLIITAISPAFELNTMWVRLRKLARAFNSPMELYWTTNAPEFHPQVTDPPLGPASIWRDITDPVTESGGLNRIPVAPDRAQRHFRLKR